MMNIDMEKVREYVAYTIAENKRVCIYKTTEEIVRKMPLTCVYKDNVIYSHIFNKVNLPKLTENEISEIIANL